MIWRREDAEAHSEGRSDDRRETKFRIGTQLTEKLDAAHRRHVEIQEH